MKYFTIEELCKTSHKVDNKPNEEQKANMEYLINNILDKARETLGMPIKVTSGFRSVELNKKVGGAANSQHTKGEAADLTCYDNKKLFNILKKIGGFDQLINEFNYSWIHVSVKRNGENKNEVLTATKINGKTTYIRG